MKGNTGYVEVFAGAKEFLDSIADFQCCHARHAPRPAASAEHGADVLHIGVTSTALEVQRGSSPTHRCAALRARLPGYRFRFFSNLAFYPYRIPLNDLPCPDDMEHVCYADPVLESLDKRMIRDKEPIWIHVRQANSNLFLRE